MTNRYIYQTKVMVIETRDEHLFASLNDTLFSLELIEEHEKISKEFDLESIQQAEVRIENLIFHLCLILGKQRLINII